MGGAAGANWLNQLDMLNLTSRTFLNTTQPRCALPSWQNGIPHIQIFKGDADLSGCLVRRQSLIWRCTVHCGWTEASNSVGLRFETDTWVLDMKLKDFLGAM